MVTTLQFTDLFSNTQHFLTINLSLFPDNKLYEIKNTQTPSPVNV